MLPFLITFKKKSGLLTFISALRPGGNKTIKFPHNNVDEAIRKSIELLNRKDFENYNIIDLRVNGKIIVE